MSEIKERFLYCLIATVLCIIVMLYFIFAANWPVVILCITAMIILLLITLKNFGTYQSAKLISENPILSVGMASVSETTGGTTESTVNVVVSGFGILMDNRSYKFGHGGIDLTATTIDRESITLSFGDNMKTYSVRLLHGIADKAEVDKLTERLRYETGVAASVCGW